MKKILSQSNILKYTVRYVDNNKINNIDYLLKEKNMPPSIYTIEGQSKLLINLVNIYKDTLA